MIILMLMASLLTYENPVVLQRADPWVWRHDDGTYYFTASVPQYDRIELRRSKTINGLAAAEPKVIWRKHPTGEMGAHIWAPELHRIDGVWYVYFAAGRAEKIWDIRIYVLSNDSPDPFAGEWRERGQLKTNWESFALDATTFEHRGKRYLAWAQNDPKLGRGTSLYLAEMNSPTSIKGTQVRISRPDLPWETIGHPVNEGAAVLKRNGRIFMTYSASATDHNYCMGLLTASEDADLLEPASWAKSPLPIFGTRADAKQFGPGHNSFTVAEDGKTDLMIYHARDYRDVSPDPLRDPNRHTRVQPIAWRADGTPDFGVPVIGAEPADGRIAPKPLFRDPIHDGAADPVVIWNRAEKKWFMFYTNRRANVSKLAGVSWVHGTRIGVADSVDGGASWRYRGVAEIDYTANEQQFSHWAPDVIDGGDGIYHMFLTFVPGMHEDWGGTRSIVHVTSTDLLKWKYQSTLKLASDRVIDAAVAKLPDGTWRLWYNEEKDRKAIYHADSKDLFNWIDKGKVIGDKPGEGPKVFRWKERWWMIVDVWDGLHVYASDDAASWTKQDAPLLNVPGVGEDDAVKGGHADVVVSGDGGSDSRAFLFYFTHPGRRGADAKKDTTEQRRSSIQVVELKLHDGRVTCDRDQPTRIRLEPPK